MAVRCRMAHVAPAATLSAPVAPPAVALLLVATLLAGVARLAEGVHARPPGAVLGAGPPAKVGVQDKDVKGRYLQWKVRGAAIQTLACPGSAGDNWRCGESMAITQDGDWLVAAGPSGRACIWYLAVDVGTSLPIQQPVHCFHNNASVLGMAAVLNDRRILVNLGKEVLLWKLDFEALEGGPPQLLCRYPQNSTARSIAASPNGEFFASGFDTGSIDIWDLNVCSATPIRKYSLAHATQVTSLVFLHRGEYIVGGESSGFAHLWSRRAPGDRPVMRFYHGAAVTSVAVDAAGTTLYSGGADGKVSFWDLGVYRFSSSINHGSPVLDILLTADSQWLISGSRNGIVRVWDTNQVGPQLAGQYQHDGQMAALVASPGGQYLVTSDWDSKGTFHQYVWDLRMRAAKFLVSYVNEQATGNVTNLELHPNGSALISGHSDGVICVWDVAVRSPQPLAFMRLLGSSSVLHLQVQKIMPDGVHLLAKVNDPSGGQAVRIMNLTSRELIKTLTFEDGLPHNLCLAVVPNSTRFVTCSSDSADVWDVSNLTSKPFASYPVSRSPITAVISPDGKWLLVGTSGSVVVWAFDGDGPTAAAPAKDLTECGSALSLAVTSDSSHFVSGGTGGQICIWELRTPNLLPTTRLSRGDDFAVTSISLASSRLGSVQIVSGGRPKNRDQSGSLGIIAFWMLTNLNEQPEPEKPHVWFDHYASNVAVLTSSDGAWLYSGGSDGMVKCWFMHSMIEYVWLLQTSVWCKANKCSPTFIDSQGSDEFVALPTWLDATPLRTLDLSGSRLSLQSVVPPPSIISVNVSNCNVEHWHSVSEKWFQRPAWIDLRGLDNPVLPTVTGLRPERRILPNACHNRETFCLARGPQEDDGLCAKTFLSVGGQGGRHFDRVTTIYVDWWKPVFSAWLCDCGAGQYGENGASCQECPVNFFCPASPNVMKLWLNERPSACPKGSSTIATGATSITDCLCSKGYYSPVGHADNASTEGTCGRCPIGTYSSEIGSQECDTCPLGYYGLEYGQGNCFELNWPTMILVVDLSILLLFIFWVTSRQMQGIHVDDVRQEGDGVVVTTCGRHWISDLHWPPHVEVTLNDTGHPFLDAPEERLRAKCLLGGYRFELLDKDGERLERRADASRGTIRPAFPFLLLWSGRPLPAALDIPIMLVISFEVAKRIHVRKRHLVMSVILAFLIAFFLRLCGRGLGRAPSVRRRIADYRAKTLHLRPDPQPCQRGPGRAVTAAQLYDLFEFFKSYIGDRDMYYVSTTILNPITKPEQLSFSEFVGPCDVTYFVSHFWGTPFQHFVSSIVKHAQLSIANQQQQQQQEGHHFDDTSTITAGAAAWRKEKYWICSLSNNQWRVQKELGNGDWARSSFYRALNSQTCIATVMVIDEEAKPLTRAWCLFEVLQTFILMKNRPGSFNGLLLCTPTGVLNYPGSASVDAAMAVARRLAFIRMEDADASNEHDKRMIANLVAGYPGGFSTMNCFIRNSIREALQVIQAHHNRQFERLTDVLNEAAALDHASSISSAKSSPVHASSSSEVPPVRDRLLVNEDVRGSGMEASDDETSGEEMGYKDTDSSDESDLEDKSSIYLPVQGGDHSSRSRFGCFALGFGFPKDRCSVVRNKLSASCGSGGGSDSC